MKIFSAKKSELPESKEIITNFPIWLHEQILKDTDNYKKPSSVDEEDIELISKWAYDVSPNLEKINSLEMAQELATQWNKQQLVKKYKTNDVVYQWENGWRIIKLPSSSFSSITPPEEHITDMEIERELMDTGDGEYRYFYGQKTQFENNEKFQDAGIIIFSLRDPQNIPRATIEMHHSLKNPKNVSIQEVFTNEQYNEENLHPQRHLIKEFFTYLKNQGYQFSTVDSPYTETINPQQLDDYESEDQFGIPYELWEVGGSEDQYFNSLQKSYHAGSSGSYWYKNEAFKIVDNLITYAEKRNQLDLLEKALEGYSVTITDKKTGKPKVQHKGFNDLTWEWWAETEDSMTWENPYPGDEPAEEDFMIQPDPNQPSIPGLPKPVPILNKKAYEEATKEYQEKLQAYEEERKTAEEYFEPYIFQNYVYEEIQKAKKRQEERQKQQKGKPIISMNTKIHKISSKELDEKLPDGEAMALYVQTLKQYLKDNPNISEEWKALIENLPSSRKVRQDFSFQECKILYETLEYLWEKITGQRIIPEKKITKAPESLIGNYWLLNNGILLKGVNHYGIVKQNTGLICSLLDISGMTLQEYLASRPHRLIGYIIRNGGVRLFITQDKRLYAQMSSKTYGDWGRDKIRKLDFTLKAVKLIDPKAVYIGWKSGISVILH